LRLATLLVRNLLVLVSLSFIKQSVSLLAGVLKNKLLCG
jgi:hypothetical protein